MQNSRFNTQLKNDGFNGDIVEFMMGHVGDRTKATYYLHDVNKLKEQYMAHMHSLAINSNGTNADLIKEHQRLKAEIERLKAHDMTERENMLSLLDDFRRMIEMK